MEMHSNHRLTILGSLVREATMQIRLRADNTAIATAMCDTMLHAAMLRNWIGVFRGRLWPYTSLRFAMRYTTLTSKATSIPDEYPKRTASFRGSLFFAVLLVRTIARPIKGSS